MLPPSVLPLASAEGAGSVIAVAIYSVAVAGLILSCRLPTVPLRLGVTRIRDENHSNTCLPKQKRVPTTTVSRVFLENTALESPLMGKGNIGISASVLILEAVIRALRSSSGWTEFRG